MKNVFFITAVILWAASCTQNKQSSCMIEGVMPDSTYNGQWVYMNDYSQPPKALDSVLVVDGKFVF
ncbi:MAG: DUF4369 domain-containing protein, partial [Tannerella sp.]|nr:DUF4369 domain-containing protein [Tannerella sp.]